MEKKDTKIFPQIIAALSATTMVIAAGFHATWASPTLPKLLADTSVPVTVSQSSWIVSFLMIGVMIGPFFTGAMVDRWGRKTSMLIMSSSFLLSSILSVSARSYLWYYAARIICGIGNGAVFTLVPIYLGEISEDRIRGRIGMLITVMVNVGYLIPYCVGPWISMPALSAVGAVIPITFVAIFAWIPETPYYYIMKDEPEKARKSLEWLRGTKNVDKEIESVKRTVEFDRENKGTLKELFTDKGNRKALILVVGLLSAQQISGSMVVANYSTVIFNDVKSGLSSENAVIITGIVQLVASIFSLFLADKAGRRILLLISMILSAIFLIGEGVYFHLKTNKFDVNGISWLPIVAMIGYLCAFMLGLGTVPMVIMSEIFSCSIKTYASMISMTYAAACAATIVRTYPIITDAYGIHFAFYGFAAGTLLLTVFAYVYLPETKRKSLAEIQRVLKGQSASKFELQEMITK